MSDVELQTLRRENDYLKRRCAQLQADVIDLEGQLARAQQERERLAGRVRQPPNALSGGQ